jgi:hypothetical protein
MLTVSVFCQTAINASHVLLQNALYSFDQSAPIYQIHNRDNGGSHKCCHARRAEQFLMNCTVNLRVVILNNFLALTAQMLKQIH